jgi:hypothetical protein
MTRASSLCSSDCMIGSSVVDAGKLGGAPSTRAVTARSLAVTRTVTTTARRTAPGRSRAPRGSTAAGENPDQPRLNPFSIRIRRRCAPRRYVAGSTRTSSAVGDAANLYGDVHDAGPGQARQSDVRFVVPRQPASSLRRRRRSQSPPGLRPASASVGAGLTGAVAEAAATASSWSRSHRRRD